VQRQLVVAATGRRRHLGEAIRHLAVASPVAVRDRQQGDALLPEPRLAHAGEAAGGPAEAGLGGRPGAHRDVVDAPDLERVGQRGLVGAGRDGVVGQAGVPVGQPVTAGDPGAEGGDGVAGGDVPGAAGALGRVDRPDPLAIIGRSWPPRK